MSRRPWFAFYFADFVGDTLHLSAVQGWGYLLLIGHYYQHGGLPCDDEQLARIARMTPDQWANERPIIAAFFEEGWRHGRIDAELAKAQSSIERGREGGITSGKVRRSQPPSNCGEANAKQTAKLKPSPTSTSTSTYSEARASEPNGSPPTPVYSDSKHQLWAEGVPILTDLGVKEKHARSCIGRWLKDTGDDAETVLGAIQRARDGRIFDPIPWITQAIKSKPNGIRHAQEDRSVHAGIDRLVDQLHALNADLAGTGGH